MLLEGKNTHRAPYLSSSKSSFALTLTASLTVQHQDHSSTSLLLCSPPPASHFGRKLSGTNLLLLPFTVPDCKASFCTSHAEGLPQELHQLHHWFSIFLFCSISPSQGPWEGHSGPSLYRSHLLPRLVELKQ